jgi:hypothetical protein
MKNDNYIMTFEQYTSKIYEDDFPKDIFNRLGIDMSKATKNSDGTYDYNGDLNFSNQNLKSLKDIGIQFRNVDGDFWCSYNQLTSLEFAPKSVRGDFWCTDNQLTTLKGAPKSVGRNFYCSNNQLTTLEGAPSSVGGDFNCNYNLLTTLEFAPESVRGTFNCIDNKVQFTKEDVKKVSAVKGSINL